ncbi:MAG: hypothetical protein OEY19_12000 [Gammaproteobacteria bacterium]|nr:hypothetical protein [Gammaproteobacteria bacterium]MDH5629901.1 hypothetical protein [Gammaproteobacteria bacterium]
MLSQLLSEMQEDDRKEFNDLLLKLQQAGGEISSLSSADQNRIVQLKQKYQPKKSQTSPNANASEASQEDIDLINTDFGRYVRQILARDLGHQFKREEDAVNHAYHSKWLPIECIEEDLVKQIFWRFLPDIETANQWRSQLVDVQQDKRMSLNMTWFMVVFQLYSILREEDFE